MTYSLILGKNNITINALILFIHSKLELYLWYQQEVFLVKIVSIFWNSLSISLFVFFRLIVSCFTFLSSSPTEERLFIAARISSIKTSPIGMKTMSYFFELIHLGTVFHSYNFFLLSFLLLELHFLVVFFFICFLLILSLDRCDSFV